MDETTAVGVLDSAIAQSGSILGLLGDISDFVINSELCLVFLGFVVISRSVGILKKCLRVTPR